jgi:hypothetical protein
MKLINFYHWLDQSFSALLPLAGARSGFFPPFKQTVPTYSYACFATIAANGLFHECFTIIFKHKTAL